MRYHHNKTAIIPIGLILTLILAAPALGADDLAYYEASARAAALGGAFTARADDAMALFYNPAGMAFLGGLRFKTDLTFGRRLLNAAWPEASQTYRSNPFEVGGALALCWQPVERVTLGAGFFSPYRFESEWPAGWSEKDVSLYSRIRTFTIRSAVAVELFKGFAASAGIDIISSSLGWRHDIAFNMDSYPLPQDAVVKSRHTLSGHGLGFTAGILWKIVPAVQVGARYQSSRPIDYSGENLFLIDSTFMSIVVPDPVQGTRRVSDLLDLFYVPQEVTGRLALPREIACGLTVRPIPRLSLAVDLRWDSWSEIGDWVFTSVNEGGDLSPEFTPILEEFYGISPDYGVQGVPLALKDTKRLGVGIEYNPFGYLAVRAGFSRNESSVDADGRSPLYPDLDRTVYSFGVGYDGPVFSIWDEDERVADLSFDLYIRFVSAAAGESSFPGSELTYRGGRLSYGVGVGFVF